MNDTKFVAEIRFAELPTAVYILAEQRIREELNRVGLSDDTYQMQFHPVAEIAHWRKPSDDLLPSPKQKQFLNSLCSSLDLKLKLAKGQTDPDIVRGQELLAVARFCLADQTTTKRRMSELIDTVKETTDDIEFILSGKTYAPN